MKIEKGPMETKQQQQKEHSRSRNKFKKGKIIGYEVWLYYEPMKNFSGEGEAE